MRHIFTLSALTALLSLFSVTASAYDIAVENEGVTIYYNYSADGTELEVTGYSGSSERVVIPEEVIYSGKTYSVTSIGQKAFYGCSGLTSVTIPNSVKSIGEHAFKNCSGLTSVTIGIGVRRISLQAFSGCIGLKKVIVKDIGVWCNIAFDTYNSGLNDFTANPLYYAHHLYSDENTEITNLVIPNSVTSIRNYAFYSCSGLTSVTIPNSVTSIGQEAFYSCSGLTSVTIPDSVTTIGDYAFDRCSSLTSVTINSDYILSKNYSTSSNMYMYNLFGNQVEKYIIGNSVKSIGEHAFSGCSGLTSVTFLGNNVTSIGRYAFSGCTRLPSITIPASVTSIGSSAFEGCSGLKKVIVKDIAAWCNIAFDTNNDGLNDFTANPLYYAHHLYSNENTEITNLVIPNSVTSIRNYAFYSCSGLTSVTIGNSVTTIGTKAFSGCSGLTSVTIGDGVISIESSAFSGCSGLTSVTIGNSVTSIGGYAFYGCSGLTSVTIPNSVTSIGREAFRDCSGLTSVTIGNSVMALPPSPSPTV